MKTQNDIGYRMRPDIILVHSENVVVMEQASFMQDDRTFILICVKGVGYAAVGKNVRKIGYSTLARWQIEHCAAVTFSVPVAKIVSIQQVSLGILLARYQREIDLWMTISNTMRYCVQHVVTR
jgi:hypothetical protein